MAACVQEQERPLTRTEPRCVVCLVAHGASSRGMGQCGPTPPLWRSPPAPVEHPSPQTERSAGPRCWTAWREPHSRALWFSDSVPAGNGSEGPLAPRCWRPAHPVSEPLRDPFWGLSGPGPGLTRSRTQRWTRHSENRFLSETIRSSSRVWELSWAQGAPCGGQT